MQHHCNRGPTKDSSKRYCQSPSLKYTEKTCPRWPGCEHEEGGSRRSLHVAQLVGDGEGGAQSVVFADAAAPVRIANRPQLGQAWSDNTHTCDPVTARRLFECLRRSKNTYLRCHTCPSLCRCPACSGEMEITVSRAAHKPTHGDF